MNAHKTARDIGNYANAELGMSAFAWLGQVTRPANAVAKVVSQSFVVEEEELLQSWSGRQRREGG